MAITSIEQDYTDIQVPKARCCKNIVNHLFSVLLTMGAQTMIEYYCVPRSSPTLH